MLYDRVYRLYDRYAISMRVKLCACGKLAISHSFDTYINTQYKVYRIAGNFRGGGGVIFSWISINHIRGEKFVVSESTWF